jgi:hypothetical protein
VPLRRHCLLRGDPVHEPRPYLVVDDKSPKGRLHCKCNPDIVP